MTVVQAHAANFETLKNAFAAGNIALMECTEKSTGEKVAVICAVNRDGENFALVPFAKFFNGNPYELLIPPPEEVEQVMPVKIDNINLN